MSLLSLVQGAELLQHYSEDNHTPRVLPSGGPALDSDLLSDSNVSDSDSDTELPGSSRTESSSHLDEADGNRRNTHHSKI